MIRSIRSGKVLFLLVAFVFCLVGSGYCVARKFKTRKFDSIEKFYKWSEEYPLHAIVINADLTGLWEFVKTSWDQLYEQDDQGKKPRYYAQSEEMEDLVELMEDYPLHMAAQAGNLEYVKGLIEAKGWEKRIVNNKDKEGLTPLYRATANKNFEIMKLLIDNGADVNEKCHGNSPKELAKNEYDKAKTAYEKLQWNRARLALKGEEWKLEKEEKLNMLERFTRWWYEKTK